MNSLPKVAMQLPRSKSNPLCQLNVDVSVYVLLSLQSSEVVGVVILERCLVQLDDDADQSLCSFAIGQFTSASVVSFSKFS